MVENLICGWALLFVITLGLVLWFTGLLYAGSGQSVYRHYREPVPAPRLLTKK